MGHAELGGCWDPVGPLGQGGPQASLRMGVAQLLGRGRDMWAGRGGQTWGPEPRQGPTHGHEWAFHVQAGQGQPGALSPAAPGCLRLTCSGAPEVHGEAPARGPQGRQCPRPARSPLPGPQFPLGRRRAPVRSGPVGSSPGFAAARGPDTSCPEPGCGPSSRVGVTPRGLEDRGPRHKGGCGRTPLCGLAPAGRGDRALVQRTPSPSRCVTPGGRCPSLGPGQGIPWGLPRAPLIG